MAVASPARLAFFRGVVCSFTAVRQILSLLVPVQRQSDEFPATTVGECRRRDDTPCEDTREDFGLSVQVLSTTYRCRVVFLLSVAGTLWLNEGAREVWSKTCSPTPLRKCNVSRGTAGNTGSRDPGKARPAVPEVTPRVAVTFWLNGGV